MNAQVLIIVAFLALSAGQVCRTGRSHVGCIIPVLLLSQALSSTSRRYQRGSVARWPISKLLNGRPVDLLGQVNAAR